MVVSAPHPSQRRSSCDICKKHKSRCQRIRPGDSKCARCTILSVACVTGKPKAVGRPRRKATPPSVGVGTGSGSTAEHRAVDKPTHPKPPTSTQQINSAEDLSQSNWLEMLGSDNTHLPTTMTPDEVQSTLPWQETGFIGNAFQSIASSRPLNNVMEHSNIPSYTEFNFDTTIPRLHSVATTPSRVSAISGTPLLSWSSPSTTTHLLNTDPSQLMFDLSKMNLDLYIRLDTMKKNKATLQFDWMISQQSLLYIDNSTLVEFSIKASYDLLSILKKLYNDQHIFDPPCEMLPKDAIFAMALFSKPWENVSNSPFDSTQPRPHVASEPIPSPTALMITSVFIQLLSLFEMIVYYLTARIERLAVDPMPQMQDVMVCGQLIDKTCTQGMLFSEVSVILMREIERILGIEGTEPGVLSSRQVDALVKELAARHETLPGYAAMSPAAVRMRFSKIADVLRNIQ